MSLAERIDEYVRACYTGIWIRSHEHTDALQELSRLPAAGSFAVSAEDAMQLVIDTSGRIRCVYGETIELSELGRLSIRRGSHVEPDQEGHWMADLSPVGGPMLGPFATRGAALRAEVAWLHQHWLHQHWLAP